MGGCTGKSSKKQEVEVIKKETTSDIKDVSDFTPIQGFGLQRMSAKKHIDIDFDRLRKYNEKRKESESGISNIGPYPILK